jgi:hypothetical protein
MSDNLQKVLLLTLVVWAWMEHHYREVNATKEEQRKARQVERARHFPPAPPTRPIMVNAN